MEFVDIYDPNDPDYIRSFDIIDFSRGDLSECQHITDAIQISTTAQAMLDDAKVFYDNYGFVVFRNVFTAEECERTRSAMWSIIEEGNPGVNGSDPSTWAQFKSAGKYGLSTRGPCFHSDIVKNRYSCSFF